jgi:tetratricopeptide (TPR) repeat protein
MSAPSTDTTCPRCGERLPAGFSRCDACGAYLAAGPSAPRAGGGGGRGALPPWGFLLIGILVGGAVGYALRSAVTPREEGGMPTGPADVMAGPGGGSGEPDPRTQMMPQVVEALGKYRATLIDDPGNVEANVGIGNLMFDSGKWEKAIEHYSTALERAPGNADVRVDRAIAYHSLGQNEKAAAELKRVTKEKPDHVNAWLNLGVVSRELGDHATTVEAWERYLKLQPQSPHAAAIRGEMERIKAGT